MGFGVVLNLVGELSIEASFKVFAGLILLLSVALYFMVSEMKPKRESPFESPNKSLSLRSSSGEFKPNDVEDTD